MTFMSHMDVTSPEVVEVPIGESGRYERKSRWSAEDEDRLRTLFAEQHDDDAIASALGRTRTSIKVRRMALGLRYRTTAEERVVVRARYPALGEMELVRERGLTRPTVQGLIRSAGLVRAPRTPLTDEQRARLLADPARLNDLAVEWGIHRAVLVGALPRGPISLPEDRPWSTRDDTLISSWLRRHGVLALARRLERSPAAVRSRARELGVDDGTPVSEQPRPGRLRQRHPRGGMPWTSAELARLDAEFDDLGVNAMARALGRARQEVKAKAAERASAPVAVEPTPPALPRGRLTQWSQTQDDLIRARYPQEGPDALASDPTLSGRSAKAIAIRAVRLGVKRDGSSAGRSNHVAWGAGEQAIVDAMGSLDDLAWAAGQLPGRSRRSIEHRFRQRMDVQVAARVAKPWSDDEDARLTALYRDLPPRDVAATLQRSYGSVVNRAVVLGLTTPSREWSSVEDQALRRDWGRLPAADIATSLGRSAHATIQRARALGLS